MRNGKENQKAGLIAGQKQKTIKVTEAESVVLIGSLLSVAGNLIEMLGIAKWTGEPKGC